jgi:hypothetical protein
MDQEQEEVIWSKPSIHDTFSFHLGLSMTVHKAQGRTVDKLCQICTTKATAESSKDLMEFLSLFQE